MPKECWPLWLLYRILKLERRRGEGRRFRGQMTERLECQSKEFEFYHHCYYLKAPGGNVPGILLSNVNHVIQSLYFQGAWKSRQNGITDRYQRHVLNIHINQKTI